MDSINKRIFLLAIFIIAGFGTIHSQLIGDPLCPNIIYLPSGEVIFEFPSDPGFDIDTIGTTMGGVTTIYTGSGSFTSPTTYTFENISPMFPFLIDLEGLMINFNFTGTGEIMCEFPLPLSLVSFTGRTTERNTNLLEWVTATEANTQWIVLERSKNTTVWEAVERLPAQGWSSTLKQYSAEDFNSYLLTYYRLRMIDLDGMEYYSDVIALERNGLSGVTISPIPAKDEVFLQFDTVEEDEITISVIDIYGRTLSEEVVSTLIGLNTVKIDIRAYASGLYYVHLDNGEDQYSKRIIKQE